MSNPKINGNGEPFKGKRVWIQCRHTLVILSFLGLSITYLLRVNLNVAIVSMIGPPKQQEENDSVICHNNLIGTTKKTSEQNFTTKNEFNWSPNDQGLILGSFFYGYVVTNFIGGPLAEHIGGKKVFGFGIVITAVLTLLTPIAANTSKYFLIALRILEGLAEGVTLPALHTICGLWIPKNERGLLYTIMHSGSGFGTVVGLPLAGAICGSSFGWQSVFYMFGSFGVIWFVFWWFLMFDSPSQHPRISDEEKEFIFNNLELKSTERCRTPWLKILTSVPVWSLVITLFCSSWCFYSVFNDLPIFISNVLHFDITSNGLWSSLPQLLYSAFQIISGFAVDFIINRKYMTRTNTRKTVNFISSFAISCCFLGVILSGCNSTWVLVGLTLGTGFIGLAVPSLPVAILDMAPSYAGTIQGLSNGIANISGFLVPQVIGALTNKNNTLTQWHYAFYIIMAISLLGGLVFTVSGSSELQPWANGEPESDVCESTSVSSSSSEIPKLKSIVNFNESPASVE